MDLTTTVQRLTKVDYLDGLGIAIGSREVSLVHVSKRVLRVALRHVRTLPLPESGRERLGACEQAVAQFLRDIEVTPDHVVLCLSRRVASVSRLIVPETARGSLRQVIDYEVERLLPFPREEIYYDHVVYEVAGGEEKRLGVVIFCLPRREVDEPLAILAQTRVQPQVVTLSSAALVNALAFCTPLSDQPCVLVAPEDGRVDFGFVERRRLVASHLFPLARMQESSQFTELLAQGIARNLPGSSVSETAIFGWGTNGVLPLAVDAGHDLCTLATARFVQPEGESLLVAALPALGAALQAVGEAGVEINLLPTEKRAQQEKRLSPLTLVLGSVLLVLGIVWAISVVVQEHRLLGVLAQRIETLNPEVQQVQAQEEEATRLQTGLQSLDATTRARVIPLLRDLTDLIPTDIYLTSFRYKDGDIELSGVATRPASDLVAVLESSPCLRNVAPKAPFTKTANGETFTLGAQVDRCD
jgi:Tfp pilus assembly protein PilN